MAVSQRAELRFRLRPPCFVSPPARPLREPAVGLVSANRKLVVIGVIGLASLGACSAPPDPRRTNFEIRGKEGVAKYDPKTGRLKKLDFDANKNGKIDSFSYWDATRCIRIEMDQDEDGKIDKWEYYDETNKIERVGSSSRDDEVQDTFAYPDANGFLGRVETDTDRDGAIDKRELFVPRPNNKDERVLSVVEYEFDKAAQPHRRLYYRPDGNFDRSEVVKH